MTNYLIHSESGLLAYCSTLRQWYTPRAAAISGRALVCNCMLCNVYGKPLQAGDKPQPHMYPMEGARHAPAL